MVFQWWSVWLVLKEKLQDHLLRRPVNQPSWPKCGCIVCSVPSCRLIHCCVSSLTCCPAEHFYIPPPSPLLLPWWSQSISLEIYNILHCFVHISEKTVLSILQIIHKALHHQLFLHLPYTSFDCKCCILFSISLLWTVQSHFPLSVAAAASEPGTSLLFLIFALGIQWISDREISAAPRLAALQAPDNSVSSSIVH